MHTAEDLLHRLSLADDPDAADMYRRLLQRGGGDGRAKCRKVQYIPFRRTGSRVPGLCQVQTQPRCDNGQTGWFAKTAHRWVFLCRINPIMMCSPYQQVKVHIHNQAFAIDKATARAIMERIQNDTSWWAQYPAPDTTPVIFTENAYPVDTTPNGSGEDQ